MYFIRQTGSLEFIISRYTIVNIYLHDDLLFSTHQQFSNKKAQAFLLGSSGIS